jgi:hypothetical protein
VTTLGITFYAGGFIRASQLQLVVDAVDRLRAPLWVVSSTANSAAITTTETVVATAAASTYRALTAYRITIRALIRGSVANSMTINVRDTDTSGTVRGGLGSFVCSGTVNTPMHMEHMVANTGSTDITSRVLVVTLIASTGTVNFAGGATIPWYVDCVEAGPSADYTDAVAL